MYQEHKTFLQPCSPYTVCICSKIPSSSRAKMAKYQNLYLKVHQNSHLNDPSHHLFSPNKTWQPFTYICTSPPYSISKQQFLNLSKHPSKPLQPSLCFFLLSSMNREIMFSSILLHLLHEWIGPVGHRLITVDASRKADFLSVQAAVDAVPDNNAMNVLIQIKSGTSIEKVIVSRMKPYITFQGEGMESTVIHWHDQTCDKGPNGQQLRTYQTASVAVFAKYFSARNISFKNTTPAPLPGPKNASESTNKVLAV